MLYKASALILPKSKFFVFGIFKPPNFAKFRDIFSDQSFWQYMFFKYRISTLVFY